MNNFTGVYAKIADSTPALYPQAFVKLDNSVFKVASLYAPLARVLSNDELIAMHSEALGDNFALIPESTELHSVVATKNYITSLVRANIVSKPYEEKAVRAMKCISKNVFIDDEDHIWKVSGQGDSARLVQSKTEDFASILNERINSRQNVIVASCTSNDIAAHDSETGDFVLFYNVKSADLDTGYAFASANGKYNIFSYTTREYEEVSTQNIIRSAVIDSDRKQSLFYKTCAFNQDLAANNGDFNKPLKNKYADYMKFLYDGTDYYKKLTDLLSLRMQTGTSHLPVSTIR
jgi:hypothetical protein